LENVVMFDNEYKGKRVWISGHTGFKGSWLCEWLLSLGAEVWGFSLEPEGSSLFEELDLGVRMHHSIGDVNSYQAVADSLRSAQPDFVFHLAAQALVRRSYAEPVQTMSTNVMGSVHVMEALRCQRLSCVVVMVTTDKCYDNKEWIYGYREEDPMGGHDPYSASKGMAELAIASYRRSFFLDGSQVMLSSARAGNVIGGGDWAVDRIVPDAMRALRRGDSVKIRNPYATRPWQHVLEPLSGYLCLGAQLSRAARLNNRNKLIRLSSGFNFGPTIQSNRAVSVLIEEILKSWPGRSCEVSQTAAVHEASLLNLATDKAFHMLSWVPVWQFSEAVARTVLWYRNEANASALDRVLDDLTAYCERARELGLDWV
jgi:CDP-glucose 4,6-dehydratase